MKLKEKIVVLTIGLLFAGSLVFGLVNSNAQQMPPNLASQKNASPTPLATPAVVEDEEPITIDTEVVIVPFTAQDNTRRLLTNLKESDVKILENGQPQEISYFARQVDLPMSLAILIDTSASQERTLPEEKEAAKTFLDSIVRPSKDEVAIVSF